MDLIGDVFEKVLANKGALKAWGNRNLGDVAKRK
jgi:hypothetical protein